ncbi:MAG: Cell division protein FtsZ [candidate division TM6 bacterium GW2011_GWE2_31_21]|nr:MAG: Cell division protein FtsZ [candidate division TM6 bacterium GW2011_GWE2_31_21]KKP53186.1 MAG: Cell division protein FtsZ [candidate division TM6 bacterium GW2011_GWF2_33_332]
MIELHVEEQNIPRAKIKVLGVGGGGGNAVNYMVESDLENVDFIIANTDAQALNNSPVENKIQIGAKVTKGLGAGANPDIGRRSAEEDIENIVKQISNSDILFLTAGMGGGTGTGATPVIAKAAKELGVLTVAVVTKPFVFEGKRRMKQAEAAIEELKKEVDTMLVIPNQKLLSLVDSSISMLNAFAMVNDVLTQAVKCVADIIVKSGHINVDFADIKAIMKGMGMAIMGTGRCSGEDRATKAALDAISSPLLEGISVDGAKGVLINITGSSNLSLQEIHDAANVIYDRASEDANIILGSVIDDSMGDEVLVTIIATGVDTFVEKETLSSIKIASPVQEKVHAPKSDIAMEFIKHHDKLEEVSQPAVIENKEIQMTSAVEEIDMLDMDDIDTPTFLRKKNNDKMELG